MKVFQYTKSIVTLYLETKFKFSAFQNIQIFKYPQLIFTPSAVQLNPALVHLPGATRYHVATMALSAWKASDPKTFCWMVLEKLLNIAVSISCWTSFFSSGNISR